LESVQAENDVLVAKHSKHAQELQEELIDFPSTADVSMKPNSCQSLVLHVSERTANDVIVLQMLLVASDLLSD